MGLHTGDVTRSLLLIPSPVLGPSCWEPVATLARQQGREVAIADLRPALETDGPLWPEMVRLARAAGRSLPSPVDVAAHSGAGALLPGVGAAMGGSVGRLVFVDAVLPPPGGAHRYPDHVRERALEMAAGNDLLPPWLDWWPAETVRRMIPDVSIEARLREDIPRIPVRWWEEDVPVPIAWAEHEHLYIRLSAAYDQELERARELGWRTLEVDSTHMGIVIEPEIVLETMTA